MPTATANTVNKLSDAQTREMSRQRRGLETHVSDLEEDLASQQQTVDELLETLRSPSAKTERQVSAERKRLKAIAAELEAAEAALAEFNETKPSEEQLAVRQSELEKQAEKEREELARQTFIANRRRAIPLITELLKLDDQIRDLPCRFNQSTGWLKDGFGAVSALKKSLVKREPRVNLHGGVESIATTEPASEAVVAELGRLLDQLTALDMHANPHWWFN